MEEVQSTSLAAQLRASPIGGVTSLAKVIPAEKVTRAHMAEVRDRLRNTATGTISRVVRKDGKGAYSMETIESHTGNYDQAVVVLITRTA